MDSWGQSQGYKGGGKGDGFKGKNGKGEKGDKGGKKGKKGGKKGKKDGPSVIPQYNPVGEQGHQHQHHQQHHHHGGKKGGDRDHQPRQHNQQQRNPVPPPPPPAPEVAVTSDSITSDMLLLPPLVHSVARPVVLSYKLVSRVLVEILQGHRHRSHIPGNLLSLQCYYAAGEEQTLPFPLPFTSTVTVEEGEGLATPSAERSTETVSVLMLAASKTANDNVVRHLSVVTKKGEDGAHLLLGGAVTDDAVASAKRHVLAQSGIDLSGTELAPFVDFVYRDGADVRTSKVFLAKTWGAETTAAKGVATTPLHELLSSAENKSAGSFEALATCDMLLEVLERCLGARVLAALEARRANELEGAVSSNLELSIMDTNLLGPVDQLTGNGDCFRLERIAGALEYVN